MGKSHFSQDCQQIAITAPAPLLPLAHPLCEVLDELPKIRGVIERSHDRADVEGQAALIVEPQDHINLRAEGQGNGSLPLHFARAPSRQV